MQNKGESKACLAVFAAKGRTKSFDMKLVMNLCVFDKNGIGVLTNDSTHCVSNQ